MRVASRPKPKKMKIMKPDTMGVQRSKKTWLPTGTLMISNHWAPWLLFHVYGCQGRAREMFQYRTKVWTGRMQTSIERARKKRRRKRDLLRLLLDARRMLAKSLRYLRTRMRTRPGKWLEWGFLDLIEGRGFRTAVVGSDDA